MIYYASSLSLFESLETNIYVCMYVYAFLCIYVCVYKYVYIYIYIYVYVDVRAFSVTQSCMILCNPMDCKILQVRLQQYVSQELSDVQAGFRKGRKTKNQIANIRWIIQKAREF